MDFCAGKGERARGTFGDEFSVELRDLFYACLDEPHLRERIRFTNTAVSDNNSTDCLVRITT
jgi:hypothetical protein